MRQLFFVTLLQTPWSLRCNWVDHYIYFRFDVAGLDITSTWLFLRLPALYACDKLHRCDIFKMLETENGKMTRQEYIKNGTLYIFKMTDKIGSNNRSSSRAHRHSHRLIQPNKSEVLVAYYCNSRAVNKLFDHSKLKELSTNKCDIDGQPEIGMWPSKREVLISPTVWHISLQFRRQTWGFRPRRARRKCQHRSRTTIGNSDMATKTGRSYATGTTTDSVEIQTVSPEFSTMASPNKVSPSDCDNDRQPEMAMWPPKPEILISLKLTNPTAN